MGGPSKTTLESRRLSVTGLRYNRSMDNRRVITPAEMDHMTPNERAAIVDAGVLHSIDDLPEPFRSRVLAKAVQLEQELQRTRDQ